MKEIILNNYRCFERLTLLFSKRVNLFVGDNSSGKTTVLRAISIVLNSFFIGFSDENTRFSGLQKDDFRIAESNSGLANESLIKIDFDFLDTTSSLELHSKKGRTLQKPLDPIYKVGKRLYQGLFENNEQVVALPLFASFSTSDIHSNRKLTRELFKKYEHKPSFGYYECLQGDGLLEYWTTRLLVLREGNTGEIEVAGVISSLILALGKDGCNIISDIHVRPIQGKVYYYLTDNRVTDTANLSDGLRRLVNIVLDLSFRCLLLNKGIYGLEACTKTRGTVLIDEIDLHLHPTLQSVVIKGLENAFPNLQFIISTHAPMVMTGISLKKENQIVKLDYTQQEGYTAKIVTTYGLDASTIIQVILGVTPRSQDVEDRLTTLFGFIDNDQYNEAAKKLKEMRKEFGDNLPELAKAEAMINFLAKENDNN